MPEMSTALFEHEQIDIDLRDPWTAGFLAWLMPGLGHFYQRRYPKALIFFLCIMPTFVAGCALGSSREVGTARNAYWSWRPGDMRFWWLTQAPLGPAVIPSVLQAWQINSGQPPMFGKFMAPPKRYPDDPKGVAPLIDVIRQKLPHYELGTYFIVIAGLMNLLAIFDAVDGPFFYKREEKKPAK
jgi:hypothetical protein